MRWNYTACDLLIGPYIPSHSEYL